MDPRDDEIRWKLDRRISIPDIVGVLGAGIAVVLSYATLDKRLTVIERMEDVRTQDVSQIKADVEYIRRMLESSRGMGAPAR